MSAPRETARAILQTEATRVDWLAAAALLLHGPVDVGTTLFIQLVCGKEDDNPVVERLGPTRWLQVKALVVAGIVVAWAIGRGFVGDEEPDPRLQLPLGLFVLLGVVFVLPNLAVALRCGRETLGGEQAPSPASAPLLRLERPT